MSTIQNCDGFGLYDTIVCPYNTSHIVGVSRMQQHLIKCRKNNPEKARSIGICPYNQSHHYELVDMALHFIVCPEYKLYKVQCLQRQQLGVSSSNL